jgi:hypothetical protein
MAINVIQHDDRLGYLFTFATVSTSFSGKSCYFFFITFDFKTCITSLVLQKTIDFRLNGENVFVFLKRPRSSAFNIKIYFTSLLLQNTIHFNYLTLFCLQKYNYFDTFDGLYYFIFLKLGYYGHKILFKLKIRHNS